MKVDYGKVALCAAGVSVSTLSQQACSGKYEAALCNLDITGELMPKSGTIEMHPSGEKFIEPQLTPSFISAVLFKQRYFGWGIVCEFITSRGENPFCFAQ